jgi:SAM-dependent methyltransferase
MNPDDVEQLQRTYDLRFRQNLEYRNRVWAVLSRFLQQDVSTQHPVLDLGCGYGEFINNVQCATKLAMDMNPDAQKFLAGSINFLNQDCSARWPLADESLGTVFTSNFFEHLPDKQSVARTLGEIFRCLLPGGRLIAIGRNIRHLPGKYWDFWVLQVPLSEMSLKEVMLIEGFRIQKCVGRFLP